MASLLSLIVAVQSSRGASLCYSYPPAPRAIPRSTRPIYTAASHTTFNAHIFEQGTPAESDEEAFGDESSDGGESTEDQDEGESSQGSDEEDGGKATQNPEGSYLGFPTQVLASLLCPRRELCDQPFEMVVNHLAFVGHPVWLSNEEELRKTDEMVDPPALDERGRSPRRGSSGSLPPVATESPRARRASKSQAQSGAGSSSRSESAPPPRESPTNAAEYLRSPSSGDTMHPVSFTSSQRSGGSIPLGSDGLISFNFICVIDTPPDSHLSSHLETFYRDVVIPVTATLKFVEKTKHWLGKEAYRLRRVKEKSVDRGDKHATFLNAAAIAGIGTSLKRLYDSIKADSIARINLGAMPVQVLLRPEMQPEEAERYSREAYEQYREHDGGGRTRTRSNDTEDSFDLHESMHLQAAPLFSKMSLRRPEVIFYPWQGLLPTDEDPEELQKDVAEGSLLWKFLDIWSPTLSFADFEDYLDLDYDSRAMKDIVNHLVHWRKAEVIDVVSLAACYTTKSDFDTLRLPVLTKEFRPLFTLMPALPIVLSQLSAQHSFSNCMLRVCTPQARSQMEDAIAWLLKKGVIEKQCRFLRVVATETVKVAARKNWKRTNAGTGSEGGGQSTEKDRSPWGSVSSREVINEGGMTIISSSPPMSGPLSGSPPVSRSSGGGSGASFPHRSPRKRTTTGKSITGSVASSSNRSAATTESELASSRGPSIILEPARPSAVERQWLVEITRDCDEQLRTLFERIMPFLDGAHSTDELRYRSDVSRRELKLVLQEFADALISFTHP